MSGRNMSDKEQPLADGCYPMANTTRHIQDGEAMIVLNDDYGLRARTTIPLLKKEYNLQVTSLQAGVVERGVYIGQCALTAFWTSHTVYALFVCRRMTT